MFCLEKQGEGTHDEELSGVVVEMIPLFLGHDPRVKLADLSILARLAFMRPMTLAGDNIARGLVRQFRDSVAGESWRTRRGAGRVVAVRELRV